MLCEHVCTSKAVVDSDIIRPQGDDNPGPLVKVQLKLDGLRVDGHQPFAQRGQPTELRMGGNEEEVIK